MAGSCMRHKVHAQTAFFDDGSFFMGRAAYITAAHFHDPTLQIPYRLDVGIRWIDDNRVWHERTLHYIGVRSVMDLFETFHVNRPYQLRDKFALAYLNPEGVYGISMFNPTGLPSLEY